MKSNINSLYQRILLLIAGCMLIIPGCKPDQPVRVLVITGGHAYDTVAFVEMWESMEGITFDTLIQPSANQWYGTPRMDEYDVLVFYDMYQNITEEQKMAFLEMLEGGKGMVFLHHSLASYQDWDEYLRIVGGRYSEDSSGYQHDLDVPVQIADPDHPVTKGMTDFVVHDETYFNVPVLPHVQPLLTTDHPESMNLLGWTHRYGRSTVIYLQPGHDNNAYSHEGYRRLIRQTVSFAQSINETPK